MSTLLLRFQFESCRPASAQITKSMFSFVDLPDVSNLKLQDLGFRSLELILYSHNNGLKIDINQQTSKLSQHLRSQLEGNSKWVFLLSASPQAEITQIVQFLEIARQAATVNLKQVRSNTVKPEDSVLYSIKS